MIWRATVIKRLLYLHGFNSSPQSEKANLTLRFFETESEKTNNERSYTVHAPALPPEPSKAIAQLTGLLENGSFYGLIGSSLGGYYSLYLHSKFNLPAVLINPAARPYELLQDYIGINENMYTGERYEVKPEHMEQLLSLDVSSANLDVSKLFLMTQTLDEVLDYRQAADKLRSCKLYLTLGGDHAYQHFSCHLPAIKAFFDSFSTIG